MTPESNIYARSITSTCPTLCWPPMKRQTADHLIPACSQQGRPHQDGERRSAAAAVATHPAHYRQSHSLRPPPSAAVYCAQVAGLEGSTGRWCQAASAITTAIRSLARTIRGMRMQPNGRIRSVIIIFEDEADELPESKLPGPGVFGANSPDSETAVLPCDTRGKRPHQPHRGVECPIPIRPLQTVPRSWVCTPISTSPAIPCSTKIRRRARV